MRSVKRKAALFPARRMINERPAARTQPPEARIRSDQAAQAVGAIGEEPVQAEPEQAPHLVYGIDRAMKHHGSYALHPFRFDWTPGLQYYIQRYIHVLPLPRS